jgi:hypothetical protein
LYPAWEVILAEVEVFLLREIQEIFLATQMFSDEFFFSVFLFRRKVMRILTHERRVCFLMGPIAILPQVEMGQICLLD